MSTGLALFISVVLLALNGFFVASEFAVVAAKRHRLEEAAEAGSRAARAAVNAHRELSLMLAGAQLGITLCTLGLGALSEPAIAHVLEPLIHSTGLPEGLSHVFAVLVAVSIVVFLHMVIGEMAPKSWTISHPETSALLVALPFRAFTWAFRPVLFVLNGLANSCLRAVRVEPVDTVESATHGPADLQMLLAESHQHGVLPDADHQMLTGALRLEEEKLSTVMFGLDDAVTIPDTGTARDVELACHDSGRSRLFVRDPTGAVIGLVHVRDAMRSTSRGHAGTPVTDLLQEPVWLARDMPLIDAVSAMRRERAQMALVHDASGSLAGLVSLEDILEQILGEFDDETDAANVRP
ncbi:MAG TPA: hemolysin family protein [Ornithinimicrobium sp.]|uniref:hemolysin family protein n=1 Tax=Ornithinimicrobium sp. TaxID=1977084 RepID=UPI002B4670C6|nr:hemolysin family protein [Ornithinimicrobium sp.]HKJ10777.1 hemolysin family protein [Ornithinimicrobium sp.]